MPWESIQGMHKRNAGLNIGVEMDRKVSLEKVTLHLSPQDQQELTKGG